MKQGPQKHRNENMRFKSEVVPAEAEKPEIVSTEVEEKVLVQRTETTASQTTHEMGKLRTRD